MPREEQSFWGVGGWLTCASVAISINESRWTYRRFFIALRWRAVACAGLRGRRSLHLISSMGNTSLLNGKRGVELMRDPLLNKGTAFTEAEREAYGLRGLLPPRVCDEETQLSRVLKNLHSKASNIEKYIFLAALQSRNEHLYYRTLISNLEEMVPLIYTPTIGEVCQKYGHIFRTPRGLFISANDRGRVRSLLENWPHRDVRIVVVTDGERILGLGDLGANGMGIPVGKLALYTACAGIRPEQCLPITIDVGTNNVALREDPLYIGLAQERLHGPAYDALIDEFVTAMGEVFPRACIQFEDLGNANAFRVLHKYEDRICTFNDDIQGTAGVTLAGIYSALRITGEPLAKQRFLFLGAGEAGLGIGSLIVEALRAEGVPEEQARRCCWFVDSKGLVVEGREGLNAHKQAFAHKSERAATLAEAIDLVRPTGLIGVSGIGGSFDRQSVEKMAQLNTRPLIFALSNPTANAECTAQQAYEWTQGRGIVATGSPFEPVAYQGQTFVPGQGNNAYIFPGVGLGVIVSESARVTNEMFLVAARTLADCVSEADLALGRVYPHLNGIREASRRIACVVAKLAFERGLAGIERPECIETLIDTTMFCPCD